MFDVTEEISYEDLLENYEYKVIKKMLIREYSWVKDVIILKPEEVNKWNLIFVDIVMDPYELGREHGWTVAPWVGRRIKEDGDYWSPYLSTYYSNTSYEDTKPLQEKMNDAMASVHDSPALPNEFRLPGRRKIQTGSFITNANIATPEDTTEA